MYAVVRKITSSLAAGLVLATLMLTGTAFAGLSTAAPEIDLGMATGGITILGVGIILLIERYRARP
jgi:hypothetical protein